MGKQSTTEITTTWHCDFCGYEEIRTDTNHRDPSGDNLPANWMYVILGPNGEECRFGTTDKINYRIDHYATAKSEFKRGIACPLCAKNVSSKISERPPAPTSPVSRWRRFSIPVWLLWVLLMGNILVGYLLGKLGV